jgi:pimeloyl-ACP methyl ester carboxylesterase
MRRLRRAAVAVALLALCCPALLPLRGAEAAMQQPPRLPGAPQCGPSTADPKQPTGGHNQNSFAAPRYFARDFPAFDDDVWGLPMGGFGGLRRGAPLRHTPVIFVHGNQADAQNWLDVMQQFQNDAGYTMQEMYALSYNGLANFYAGAPVGVPPTPLDQAYAQQNPNALANGGRGAADDDEVPDLCRFIEAVQWYTGSEHVDIVAHSLGVTITRKLMYLYPSLARDIVAFVGIAGANHGTSVCRGLETSYYGCNEIAPGTAWLEQLNGPGGSRETYAPTRWMTVFNGTDSLDPFFSTPDVFTSPALKGADNRTMARTYHNDLRVSKDAVDVYLPFLLRFGQVGPGAAAAASAGDDATRVETQKPDGMTGHQLCGVPDLTGPVAGCPELPPAAGPLDSTAGQAPGGGGDATTPALSLPNTASAAPAGQGAVSAITALVGAGVVFRSRRTRGATRR